MKIYYVGSKIVRVNWNKDDFAWLNNTNNAATYNVDEIDPENKELCIDIMRVRNQVDINNNPKYYIDADGDLADVDGWISHTPPPEEFA